MIRRNNLRPTVSAPVAPVASVASVEEHALACLQLGMLSARVNDARDDALDSALDNTLDNASSNDRNWGGWH